jgi:hypothetical protein
MSEQPGHGFPQEPVMVVTGVAFGSAENRPVDSRKPQTRHVDLGGIDADALVAPFVLFVFLIVRGHLAASPDCHDARIHVADQRPTTSGRWREASEFGETSLRKSARIVAGTSTAAIGRPNWKPCTSSQPRART